MTYSFSNLSPVDFEDLARDLIGTALGVRFEAFAPGPDGGIDGRHTSADATIILQAKHYAGSTWSDLKAAMKKERRAIDRLRADRYVLVTSGPPCVGKTTTAISAASFVDYKTAVSDYRSSHSYH